jgi:isopenicillin N synthase-like dioxygenase
VFFDRLEDEKLRYVPIDKAVNRGYAAYGSEALAYSLGVDTKPDMFEAFNCGVDVVDESDPYVAAERHRFFAPNMWPSLPSDMREVWVAYFDACQALAGELSRMFAVALDMPEGFIFEHMHRAASVMRANNYERRSHHPDPEPGQVRMGAHTDYGVCTILLADPVPGLQIVGPDGAWHDVMPEPGTLLVNLGDLLAEWTNDRWRSTLHRVVPPRGIGPARRRSVAFFQEANYDAVISVMPTCFSDDNPARYEPVIAGEHLMNKLIGPRTLKRSTAVQTSVAALE